VGGSSSGGVVLTFHGPILLSLVVFSPLHRHAVRNDDKDKLFAVAATSERDSELLVLKVLMNCDLSRYQFCVFEPAPATSRSNW
jgi:hypothetical protein